MKDQVEEGLLGHRRDRFSALDLVFFDTTSIDFEGEGGRRYILGARMRMQAAVKLARRMARLGHTSSSVGPWNAHCMSRGLTAL